MARYLTLTLTLTIKPSEWWCRSKTNRHCQSVRLISGC